VEIDVAFVLYTAHSMTVILDIQTSQ